MHQSADGAGGTRDQARETGMRTAWPFSAGVEIAVHIAAASTPVATSASALEPL